MRALNAPAQARPMPPCHNPPGRTPPPLRPAWVRGVTACFCGLFSTGAAALIAELATTTPLPATTSPPAATSAVTAGAARSDPDDRTGR